MKSSEGNALKVVPVVIVGRNRSRMTVKVAESLKGKLDGYEPYVIHISDRSRRGHCDYVRKSMEDLGIKCFVGETTTDRWGWGAAINIGLEIAFKESDFALVLDNDWILQRKLNIQDYVLGMASNSFGCVTFKQHCDGTNIDTEEFEDHGRTYISRVPRANGNATYAMELGCMFVSKQFCDKMGRFTENVSSTDKVELDAAWKFMVLFYETKSVRCVTDKSLLHFRLNGDYHVFTHIGLNSTQMAHPSWYVPEEYVYLSDDAEDRKACEEFCDVKSSCAGDDVEIDWKKYFDRIICVSFQPKTGYRDYLMSEFKRVGILDSGIFEMRYTVPTRYDEILFSEMESERMRKIGYMNAALEINRAVKSSVLEGLERIWILEDDIAFLKDKREIIKILDSMPTKVGVVQLSKFVFPAEVERIKEYSKQNLINEEFFNLRQGLSLTDGSSIVLNRSGMEEWTRIQEEHLTASDLVYRYLRCGLACSMRNISVQVFCDGCCNMLGYGAMKAENLHACYLDQGIKYEDYNVPVSYEADRFFKTANSVDRKITKKGRKFVSVYAIAKNESKFAKRWYECMSEADEVCVLDTGSTDDTVKILTELGAKVTVRKYDKWRFDTARNDSMSLVSPEAEILFTTDIDETIKPGWRKKLEDAWIAAEEQGLKPTNARYKYVWSYNPDGTEAQFFEVHKAHAKGVCVWKHRIHEYPSYKEQQVAVWVPDFVVEHHQDQTKARSFYLDLLREEASDFPDDDRSAHYYGRELMYVGKLEEAITELKRHLSLPSAGWRAERAASMRYIARCYGRLGNLSEFQLWMFRAAEEDPTNREATFELGEFYIAQKDYRSAVLCLQRCIAIEKPSLEYISQPYVWTAKPYVLLSQALWWAGDWNGAEKMVRLANSMEPDNGEIKAQMNGMIETRKKHNK